MRGLRCGSLRRPVMRIKGQADIDVFISDGGYICLKQTDEVDGDRIIEFAPAYGAKVAGAIHQLPESAQAKFEKAELAEVDCPGAPGGGGAGHCIFSRGVKSLARAKRKEKKTRPTVNGPARH